MEAGKARDELGIANAGVVWTVEGGAAEGLMTRITFCTGAEGLDWKEAIKLISRIKGIEGNQGYQRKRTLLTTSAACEGFVGNEDVSGGEVVEKDDEAGEGTVVGEDARARGSSFSRGGTNAKKLAVCSRIAAIIYVANA